MTIRPFASLLLLAALLAGTVASAQTTFTVTAVTKTAAHPYFGQGHPTGYAIDGVEGAELTLQRGRTYTFQMSSVSSTHPFYISTSASGGGAGEYTDGVTGAPASGNATVTFAVPAGAPDELWYQCDFHGFMGYRITVINPTTAEGEPAGYALRMRSANPGRGDVRFSVTLPSTADATVEVVTTTGRRVAVLHDGALSGSLAHAFSADAAGLASGLYVVRVRSGAWEGRQSITVVR